MSKALQAMILTCPSCGARFQVDDEQLPPAGRRVRCGRCHHTWHAKPAADAEPESAAAAAAPAAETGTAEPAAEAGPEGGAAAAAASAETGTAQEGPPRTTPPPLSTSATEARLGAADEEEPPAPSRGRGVLVGWLALAVVVIALAAGLWFGRERIVAAVPQTARLYEMAGLAPAAAPAPLEFRDVARERRLVDDTPVLAIEGRIVNRGAEARAVPPIRARLLDGDGKVLAEWTFEAATPTVEPGAATTFSTERREPSQEAKNLSLSFAAEEDGG